MSLDHRHADPEDMFADTRMSFGDHIEELRVHLWRAIVGFMVAVFASFFFGQYVLEFIAHPVEVQLLAFYNKRVENVLKELKNDPKYGGKNEPTRFVELAFYRPQLQALLAGLPAEDVNNVPPPVWEDADDAEQKVKDGGKLVGRQDVVRLWVSHWEPVREAALLQQAQYVVGKRPGLTTLNVQEAFMVYFKVCLVSGFVVGSPWIFYQIWAFVAAGLYPHEKRYVHLYLPFSLGLFLVGVVICELFVIPKAVEALLWFNEWIGLEPDLRLNEWLGFAIIMPLIFGVSFQTPLVMLFLERIGVMDIDSFRAKRRISFFAMAVFAAVITPSTDPFSMLFLWVPMCGLFELGIYLWKISPRPKDLDLDVPEPEEMVGV